MEEKLNIYYKEIARILLEYRDIAKNFIDKASIALYKGYEEGNVLYQNPRFYEMLMVTQIFAHTHSLSPFLKIDADYYSEILNEYIENIDDSMTRVMEIDFTIEKIEKGEETSKELTTLYQAFHHLTAINREGWVSSGVSKEYQENDAEHTMQLLLFISAFFRGMKPNLDFSKVFMSALIHEVGESKAGDVIDNGSEEHRLQGEIEEVFINALFSPLAYGEELITLWHKFEHKLTEEAKACYQADKLDAVLKAGVLDEVSNVHTLFDEFSSYEVGRNMFDNSVFESVFLKAMEINKPKIIK